MKINGKSYSTHLLDTSVHMLIIQIQFVMKSQQ